MKKILLFSLAALVLGTSAANAQVRKWNFTSWSAETQANLMAGAFENSQTAAPASGWSDIEKATGTAPTDVSKANCFWEVTAQGTAEGATLMANNAVIKELEGLLYINTAARSLAIALNYQEPNASSSFGPYHGASYLWLGSNKKNYFVIPNVALGSTITMGVESHKITDARGVELYAGTAHTTSGTKLKDADGNDVAVPTAYTEQEWVVPADLADGLNEDGTVDVLIYNTNGCHLYYITVDDHSSVTPDDVKVAYLYDSSYGNDTGFGYGTNGGLESDPIWNNPVQSYSAQAIDLAESVQTLTAEELNDSLISYDVVILSEAVSSGNKYAKALNGIINFVPMLNLKSYMYKNWGYGKGANPSPKATAVKVGEDYLDSPLFADIDIDEEGNITLFDCEDVSTLAGGNLVQGYTATAGKLFADDEVIATVSGINAIHSHGTRNQYMLIPISSDNLNLIAEPTLTLVYNAISVLALTKSKVQNAAAPIVSQAQSNQVTTVTLSCTTADAAIYYTVDGTEPTEASAVYSEPFTVTVDSTVVKAFAIAHGYNNSDVTTATIRVFGQAAAPVISVDGATFTITAAEGAKIYYNYLGSNKVAESAVYSDTVTVAEPTTVTAFVTADDALQSEVATAEVTVEGYVYRYDIMGHFDAKRSVYGTPNFAANTKGDPYLFSWGNKAVSSYDSTNVIGTHVVPAVDGSDSTVNDYAIKTPETVESEDWIIASSGQVITNENGTIAYGVGDGTSGYFAETAEDTRLANDSIGITANMVNFKGRSGNTPFTATISSKQKFAGPFDIIVYTANGGTGHPDVDIQISADGQTWDSIASVNYAQTRRYRCRTKVAYNEANEVYVRVAHMGGGSDAIVYDIYILNAGEHTQEVLGIRAIEDVPAVINGVTYNLFGQQVDKNYKGIVIRNGKKMILR